MSPVIEIKSERFNAAAAAVMAGSKRSRPEVLLTQAKGVLRNIIEMTPPAHVTLNASGGNTVVMRGDAKAHGEALVSKDIRGIYGTPSQAFDQVRGSLTHPGIEKGFWKHLKSGQFSEANAILAKSGGKPLSPFDGGTLHKRLKGAGGRPNNKSIVYYVTDARELDTYIKVLKRRVGWLAGGWNQAAGKLGLQPPAWIWRQESPGRAILTVSDTTVTFFMTNEVRFASEAADLQRRVQWAMDTQAAAMERITRNYLETLMKRAGFAVAGVLT